MTRVRRDPRADRRAAQIASLDRPRFDLAGRAADGGPGRPRRNPRTEFAALRVTGAARPRFDRQHRGEGAVAQVVSAASTPNVIVVDAPAFLVAVVPDAPGGRLTQHDRQLFGAARTLAGAHGAVAALVAGEIEGLGAIGADRVAALASTQNYAPDVTAAALASAFAALSPRHLLFPETPDGGDLARRLALLTGEPLFPDVEQLSATSVSRAARGKRVAQRAAPARLMTLGADVVAPYSGPAREGRSEPLPTAEVSAPAITDARRIPADPATTPLTVADFVVSAGNGVTDIEAFRRLAEALGATPGASRVLCDAGLMPRASQVGASGSVLTATCYLALGVAGAPQHLQGVAGCEHVVAVNTDLHAAMIERAGLAIVQDAQLVMPALIAALESERAS
ncbi:electron transfer flavoprotein subunit alpha/FixB family protein [Hansschlegelia plantiphila]|uniref:Electron transfer flavoprotein subunit alpha n=1 Tax=Hansschlegelia plantiphila TaxID=374655 RepID=A0A9W6J0F0_9HYPH|nr:electron transfer flavoprotein subunit alpha/FixB family protein [Hansschlegelia plantiphila]GLK66980.1 electron transfer flavoprotein subunit alpha [Hansschlegelia plantiphila]